jgi:hypothetical protein
LVSYFGVMWARTYWGLWNMWSKDKAMVAIFDRHKTWCKCVIAKIDSYCLSLISASIHHCSVYSLDWKNKPILSCAHGENGSYFLVRNNIIYYIDSFLFFFLSFYNMCWIVVFYVFCYISSYKSHISWFFELFKSLLYINVWYELMNM